MSRPVSVIPDDVCTSHWGEKAPDCAVVRTNIAPVPSTRRQMPAGNRRVAPSRVSAMNVLTAAVRSGPRVQALPAAGAAVVGGRLDAGVVLDGTLNGIELDVGATLACRACLPDPA